MTANTTHSRKAKGRRLQQKIVSDLHQLLSCDDKDIKSNPMSSSGEDIWMSSRVQNIFPYSIECKNTESLAIWKALEQCKNNSHGNIPLLIFKRNNSDIYVTLKWEDLYKIIHTNIYDKNKTIF